MRYSKTFLIWQIPWQPQSLFHRSAAPESDTLHARRRRVRENTPGAAVLWFHNRQPVCVDVGSEGVGDFGPPPGRECCSVHSSSADRRDRPAPGTGAAAHWVRVIRLTDRRAPCPRQEAESDFMVVSGAVKQGHKDGYISVKQATAKFDPKRLPKA